MKEKLNRNQRRNVQFQRWGRVTEQSAQKIYRDNLQLMTDNKKMEIALLLHRHYLQTIIDEFLGKIPLIGYFISRYLHKKAAKLFEQSAGPMALADAEDKQEDVNTRAVPNIDIHDLK